MADKTKIEWTDATWNPVTGCDVISPGCTNCYAMKLAGTRLKNHPSRAGLTHMTKAGPVWNGEVRFNRQWLLQPAEWKRPRRVFVAAHGDLFHHNVKDEWLLDIFTVMASNPRHTFQILTKRPERMMEYLSQADLLDDIYTNWYSFDDGPREVQSWPLPNVWLGVSVESQDHVDQRISLLLRTPAAKRFVSAEPLLGPVDLLPHLFIYTHEDAALLACDRHPTPTLPWHDPATTRPEDIDTPRLDWVIAGGESGDAARPTHPVWIRALRDQCIDAAVPFFFKQWGEWAPFVNEAHYTHGGEEKHPHAWVAPDGAHGLTWLYDDDGSWQNHTGSPPADLSRVAVMGRHGKKAAGAELDGKHHREWPV